MKEHGLVLCIKSNGTGGSASFSDLSPLQQPITVTGTPTHSTANSLPGKSSSIYFPGASNLSIPDSDYFEFGSGDFSLSVWHYLTTWGDIIAKRAPNEYSPFLIYGTIFYATSTGTTWDITGGTTLGSALNEWMHICVVRQGSVFSTYKNGIFVASVTSTASLYNNTSVLRIGGGVVNCVGYLDEIKIYNVAVHPLDLMQYLPEKQSEIHPKKLSYPLSGGLRWGKEYGVA